MRKSGTPPSASRAPKNARIFTPFIGKFPPIEADIINDEEFSLKEYGIDGTVLHTPGHTAGSQIVFLDGEHVISGDTIFGGRTNNPFPPFTDNVEQMIRSWKVLIDKGIKYIHPGHGNAYPADNLFEDFEKRRVKYRI